jgi:hypothetical protein
MTHRGRRGYPNMEELEMGAKRAGGGMRRTYDDVVALAAADEHQN